jgi:hypothetical protein
MALPTVLLTHDGDKRDRLHQTPGQHHAWCLRRTQEVYRGAPTPTHLPQWRRRLAKFGPFPAWARNWLQWIRRPARGPDETVVRLEFLKTERQNTLAACRQHIHDAHEQRRAETIQRRDPALFRLIHDPLPADLGGVECDGAATLSPDAVLADQFDTWSRWWGDAGAEHAHQDIGHVLRSVWATISVEVLTPETIRAAWRSFSASTSAVDGMHPQQVALLSDGALHGLAALFGFFDRSQCFNHE